MMVDDPRNWRKRGGGGCRRKRRRNLWVEDDARMGILRSLTCAFCFFPPNLSRESLSQISSKMLSGRRKWRSSCCWPRWQSVWGKIWGLMTKRRAHEYTAALQSCSSTKITQRIWKCGALQSLNSTQWKEELASCCLPLRLSQTSMSQCSVSVKDTSALIWTQSCDWNKFWFKLIFYTNRMKSGWRWGQENLLMNLVLKYRHI